MEKICIEEYEFPNFYQKNPFRFQAVDLMFWGPSDICRWIGSLTTTLLFMRNKINDKRAIHQIIIILPQSSITKTSEVNIREAIAAHLLKLRDFPVDKKESIFLKKLVKIVNAPDLTESSLLAIINEAGTNVACIVANAAKYRSSSVQRPKVTALSTMKIEEDIWAPHLHALASSCIQAAKTNNAYIYIDTGEWFPMKDENGKPLYALDDCCGITECEKPEQPDKIISPIIDKLSAMIATGDVQNAMSVIDNLPSQLDMDHKIDLKIQLLKKAGFSMQAFELIKDRVDNGKPLIARLKVKYAGIAHFAGEPEFAATLLVPAIAELDYQEDLDCALNIAVCISALDLKNQCVERLTLLFPDSVELSNYTIDKQLTICEKLGLQKTEEAQPLNGAELQLRMLGSITNFSSNQPEADCLKTLQDGLSNSFSDLDPISRLSCLVYAKAAGYFDLILGLAKLSDFKEAIQKEIVFDIAIWAIERSLLGWKPARGLNDSENKLLQCIAEMIKYLANNPDDVNRRAIFVQCMSMQVAGSSGEAILALSILKSVKNTKVQTDTANKITMSDGPTTESISIFMSFFKSALQWMENNGPIVLGQTKMPAALLPISADALFKVIYKISELKEEINHDDIDVCFLTNLVAVGVLISPHCETPNQELILLRTVSSRFAFIGRTQLARDYAEQALVMAGTDPLRMRLAWFAFADVYHRLNNPNEALLAMACTLTCAVPIQPEQAWYEIYGLIRILRDIGLISFARELMPQANELIGTIGLKGKYQHRLDSLELGLRLKDLGREDLSNAELMQQLLKDAQQNCANVHSNMDELTPSAVTLGQIISLCQRSGHPIDEAAQLTLSQVKRQMGENHQTQIRMISDDGIEAKDVLALVNRLDIARNYQDIGYDIRMIVLAAKKLLSGQGSLADSCIASFAIELLCDHSISTNYDQDKTTANSRLISSIQSASTMAINLSKSGLMVVMLGYNENDEIIQVVAQNGHLNKPCVISLPSRTLQQWERHFPYEYGMAEHDDTNLFFQSMGSLNLSVADGHPTLFVMSTNLQQIPPNLILYQEGFLGSSFPTAVAPSLSWLNQIRDTERKCSGSTVAWIPTNGDEGSGVLAKVNEWLAAPTFADHNIIVENSTELPKNMKGADLAIIGAHGGIGARGRTDTHGKYFNAITDDEKKVSLGQLSLSNALTGTRVVILFVCSGGRFDQHPHANTTIGLPKELLNNGCLAVVASSWPICATLVNSWLPTFLEHWHSKKTVMEANFLANKAVEKMNGFVPQSMLAMTVYGDPMTTKF